MIEFEHVTFGYRRGHLLFLDLSFRMGEGHIYGLLGGNGVGKTTLLKLACGLLSPCEGTVRLFGQSPERRRPSLYRELFVIPEEFDLPAIDFRTFVCTTSPFYPHFSQEALENYCRELEIDTSVRLQSLSMGQKKRALIAFALACNVRLLVMDEPTNGLDIPAKAAFRRLMAAYADERHSVLISTHQVRDIELLIDQVVVIDNHGILLNQSLDRIMEKLYFGSVSADDDPIYREESLQGQLGVIENRLGVENKVDLELLYKATVCNRERIYTLFNR